MCVCLAPSLPHFCCLRPADGISIVSGGKDERPWSGDLVIPPEPTPRPAPTPEWLRNSSSAALHRQSAGTKGCGRNTGVSRDPSRRVATGPQAAAQRATALRERPCLFVALRGIPDVGIPRLARKSLIQRVGSQPRCSLVMKSFRCRSARRKPRSRAKPGSPQLVQ